MIFSAVFGFIFGIMLGSFGVVGLIYFFTFVSLSLLIYFYKFFIEKEHRGVLFFASIFLLGLAFGILRINFSDINKSSTLEKFENEKVSFSGVVVEEPDVRETNTRLMVLLSDANLGTSTVPLSEKIIISVNLYPEFYYGDKISFTTKLNRPKNIESDSGRIFDYIGYLRARGVWYTASYVYPELVSKDNGNIVKKYLFIIKKKFTNSINNVIPEPESSLLSGILLGSKQSLGKNLLNEFNQTGVSHIVVLSGYNIAIVASSIISFLYFLPKNLSFTFGCLGIILFTVFSGGGSSAVRAAIMVIVALFAKRFNRDYRAGRVLGFTVILMLAPNPLLLVFDPSFQLSVLATVGLVFVSPVIISYFTWITERFGLREIVSTTIATQLTVLPLLIYNTGILSIVSLPVNILVLGIIPTIMFLGFVTGLVGFVSSYIAMIPGIISFVLLKYQLFVIHFGANLPFSYFQIPKFSFEVLIFVYIIIFIFLFFINKNPKS